ncbi:MAG: hypothetical protein KKC23_09960, partial [Proteobacteria bacterium]|nr:hypothetical protein [Pseudomonadota bacterium]
MGRQAAFGNLDETIKLCEETGVVPTTDFAHIHARGNGCLKTRHDFGEIFDKLEKLNLKKAGFIDIQSNGYKGIDFSSETLTL